MENTFKRMMWTDHRFEEFMEWFCTHANYVVAAMGNQEILNVCLAYAFEAGKNSAKFEAKAALGVGDSDG